MRDPDCYYHDHTWRDGAVCVRCGAQLRCGICGQFCRLDSLERHCEEKHPIPEDERDA